MRQLRPNATRPFQSKPLGAEGLAGVYYNLNEAALVQERFSQRGEGDLAPGGAFWR